MVFKLKTVLFIALSTIPFSSPGLADVFYWQHPVTKLSVAYPDDWRAVHNQEVDDVLTVAAPDKDGFVSCRFRVRDEGRFKIYPARFSDEIHEKHFGARFWDGYFAENIAYRIDHIDRQTGLGRGHATMARAVFLPFDSKREQRQAVAFVSLYNNMLYIAECSAPLKDFQKWHPQFMSILKSVNFRKEIHELPSGNYRSFLGDYKTWVRNGEHTGTKKPEDLKQYW